MSHYFKDKLQLLVLDSDATKTAGLSCSVSDANVGAKDAAIVGGCGRVT